jgi:hypothetical protein
VRSAYSRCYRIADGRAVTAALTSGASAVKLEWRFCVARRRTSVLLGLRPWQIWNLRFRMLERPNLAAREADIVGLSGLTFRGGGGAVPPDLSVDGGYRALISGCGLCARPRDRSGMSGWN